MLNVCEKSPVLSRAVGTVVVKPAPGRAVVKLLVGEEEESLVASVVEPGEDYRAAYLESKLVS